MDVQPTPLKPRERRVRPADNRQQLVDAGHAVLSEKGLRAVTVKEVARVAGVSPGLFHYYFASKDDLLLAVLEDAGQRFKTRLVRQVGQEAGRDRIGAAIRFIEETAQREPELFRLRYEFYALGLRNPEFLSAVGKQLAAVRADIAHILGQWFPAADEARTRALAPMILACFDGLALQRIADSESDVTPAYALLRELMKAELTPM